MLPRKMVGVLLFAGVQLACTTLLGDDFEIVPSGSGGAGGSTTSSMGGDGGAIMDCTPNEVSCADESTLQLCDAEGNASTEACGVDAPACLDGACVPCLDTELRCSDDIAQVCQGNDWVDGETCNIGCDAGACLTVTDIGAGTAHTCAALSNGTVRCWGYTNLELLFLCFVDDPAAPSSFTPTPMEVPGLTDAKRIASGNAHNCVLTETDGLKCWGWNGLGRLGNGSVMNEPLPVDILLPSTVSDFAVGVGHTCAALNDGTTHCWGLNEQGQVGNGQIDNPLFYNSPQQVLNLILPAVQLDAGSGNTCMRDSGKNGACWGDGGGNQLGASTMDQGSPVFIGGDGVDEIRVGSNHSCHRKGTVVSCMGRNNDGQVGDGTITDPITSPQQVNVVGGAAQMDLAGNRTCVIDNAGALICWGRNAEGQLGIGSSGVGNEVNVPTAVPLAGTVKDIALGFKHTCVITTDDRLLCWGANNHGQVGLGMESPVVDTPTQVVW